MLDTMANNEVGETFSHKLGVFIPDQDDGATIGWRDIFQSLECFSCRRSIQGTSIHSVYVEMKPETFVVA